MYLLFLCAIFRFPVALQFLCSFFLFPSSTLFCEEGLKCIQFPGLTYCKDTEERQEQRMGRSGYLSKYTQKRLGSLRNYAEYSHTSFSSPLQKCSVLTVVMLQVKEQLKTVFVLITNESS
jgi:hypothetical protein